MFMKLDSSSQNLDSLIEQYNRELMRFYQQNAPRIQPDGEPVEEPEGPGTRRLSGQNHFAAQSAVSRRITGGRCASVWNKKARHPCPTRPKATRQRPHSLFHRRAGPFPKAFPIHLEDRILEEGLLPGVPLVEEPGALGKPMPAENSEQTPQQIFTPQAPESSPEEGPAVLPEELSLPMSTGYLQVFLSSARGGHADSGRHRDGHPGKRRRRRAVRPYHHRPGRLNRGDRAAGRGQRADHGTGDPLALHQL